MTNELSNSKTWNLTENNLPHIETSYLSQSGCDETSVVMISRKAKNTLLEAYLKESALQRSPCTNHSVVTDQLRSVVYIGWRC